MHAWTTPKCKDGTERGTDFGFRAPAELNAPLKPGQAKPTVGTIYSEIGFAGLWGGLGTRILMVGTLTALQWVRRFRIIESQKIGRFCSLFPLYSSSTTRSRSPWVSRPLVRPLRTPPRSKRRLDRDALLVLLLLPLLVVLSSPTRVLSPYLFNSNVPILKSFKALYTTTKPLFVPYLVFASPSRENVYRTFSLKLVRVVCFVEVQSMVMGERLADTVRIGRIFSPQRQEGRGGLIADQPSPPRSTHIGRSYISPGIQ